MLQITESNQLIATIFEMELFSDDTKERVKDADILLLPEIGVIDEIEKAFRPDTKSFLKFAKANNSKNYKIELFENTGEEIVLNFHSHDIYLPVIYLRDTRLLPELLELVLGYVEQKIIHGRNDEPVVNLIIKVEEKGICKVYTYKGLIDRLKVAFLDGGI